MYRSMSYTIEVWFGSIINITVIIPYPLFCYQLFYLCLLA